jgi:hypothetical protein
VACAALLPDRVLATGVISGVGDFAWHGAWNGYDDSEATLMRLGDEDQIAVWCQEPHYGADGMGSWREGRVIWLPPTMRPSRARPSRRH